MSFKLVRNRANLRFAMKFAKDREELGLRARKNLQEAQLQQKDYFAKKGSTLL